ncbi:MAG: hypothetical protein AAFP82_20345 [Bacteroidota bacterium]
MKSKASVLLVESDEGLRRLITSVLQHEYQMIPVNTTIDAWRYLFSVDCLPTILIIDLDNTHSDNRELVRQIKENGMLREIPIITLCSNKGNLAFSSSIDIDESIQKPFDPNLLKKKMIDLTPQN